MRRVRVGLLLACVLAAGCSGTATGGWSAGDPTATLTPVPVPETRTASAASVPGVSAGGTVDADRLADAHARAVAGRSYTWVFRLTRAEPERDAPTTNATRRVRVGADATLVTDERAPGYPSNRTVYLTERRGYQRLRASGATMTVNRTHGNGRYVFAESLLRFTLRDGTYRARTVERDGARYVQLRDSRGTSGPGPRDENGGTGTAADNYTATVLVAPSGFVRRFAVSFIDLRGDRVSFSFRYAAVGETTAPEPGWVAGVRADAEGARAGSPTVRDDGTATPGDRPDGERNGRSGDRGPGTPAARSNRQG